MSVVAATSKVVEKINFVEEVLEPFQQRKAEVMLQDSTLKCVFEKMTNSTQYSTSNTGDHYWLLSSVSRQIIDTRSYPEPQQCIHDQSSCNFE